LRVSDLLRYDRFYVQILEGRKAETPPSKENVIPWKLPPHNLIGVNLDGQ